MKKSYSAYRFNRYFKTLIGVFVIIGLLAGQRQSLPALARSANLVQPRAYLPLTVNSRIDSSGPNPAEKGWLAYLNRYRGMALLPPLVENKDWGQGGWYHSRYMVKNDDVYHGEDPANLWYTREGDLAGQSGNLVGSYNH